MQTSPETKELFAALFAVQNEMGAIANNESAKIGDKFSYKYTDMAGLHKTIRPLMETNGLLLTQEVGGPEGDICTVTGRLVHVPTGQWIEYVTAYPVDKADIKKEGGQFTYLRRYQQFGIFNVATDDDPDKVANEPANKRPPKQEPMPPPHNPLNPPDERIPDANQGGELTPAIEHRDIRQETSDYIDNLSQKLQLSPDVVTKRVTHYERDGKVYESANIWDKYKSGAYAGQYVIKDGTRLNICLDKAKKWYNDGTEPEAKK